MGIFSKLIGGYLGFSLGGPLGAIVGVALASFLDREGTTATFSGPRLTSQDESQTVFFVATFSLLGKLAKIDGRVSHEEIAVVENFMFHDLKLDEQSAAFAQNIFEQAKHSTHDYHEIAQQFASHFQTQPSIIQGMMDLLLRVAAADGRLDSKEEEFVDEVSKIFGIPSSVYDHLRQKYIGASNKHYAILDLEPTATNEEIKRKYKKMVLEHHPDRVVSQGMPEEFKQLAEQRFHEIQKAYEMIKKERGI